MKSIYYSIHLNCFYISKFNNSFLLNKYYWIDISYMKIGCDDKINEHTDSDEDIFISDNSYDYFKYKLKL